MQKISGGVTTTYHTVGGNLMEEVSSDGKTLVYLLDENGDKYGVIYNGTYYYYFFNLQGDVIGIYNSSGTIVARYVYDAWGKTIAVTDTNGNTITDPSHIANQNPIRYRGYYYDNETGFYYLQSRYYDPTVGRFINADAYVTTGQGLGSFNMFAYCLNNPVIYKDPNGKSVAEAVEPSIWEKMLQGVAAVVSVGAAITSSAVLFAATVLTLPFLLTSSSTQTKEKDKDIVTTKINDEDPRRHHIVAQHATDAEPARLVLENVGININDPANIVILPQGYHKSMHTRVYYQYVNMRLEPYYRRQKEEVYQVLLELQIEILTSCAAGIRWD